MEEWSLTVCLYHAMFGGKCHRREFWNIRPAYHRILAKQEKKVSWAPYSIKELHGWTDPIDGPLYKYGKEKFRSNLDKYGVNRETCKKRICSCCPEAFPPEGKPVPQIYG